LGHLVARRWSRAVPVSRLTPLSLRVYPSLRLRRPVA
jgi:hypothetical protein